MAEQSPSLIAILAEAEMRSFAQQYVSGCDVSCMEPTQTWFLIKTKTDADRDRLTSNPAVSIEFLNISHRAAAAVIGGAIVTTR
jgi:hypothetical protein